LPHLSAKLLILAAHETSGPLTVHWLKRMADRSSFA